MFGRQRLGQGRLLFDGDVRGACRLRQGWLGLAWVAWTVAAAGDMQGDGHAKVEQDIGERRPLGLLLTVLLGLDKVLQLIDHLPDPHRRAHGTTEKGQHGVEYQPAGLLERGPTVFGIGNRLPIRQFDQGIGVGFEQSGKSVAVKHLFTQRHGAAHGP